MNPARWLVFALAGGMVSVSGVAQVQTPVAVPAEAVSAQPPGQADVLIEKIQAAQDPSSAIQAYAEARAAAPNDLAPLKAYVHRMAELGLPEMADVQTQELLKRAPEDGVAWAMAGYVAAKRDQMDVAVTDLVAAVRLTPDDVFVQRTAGQLVAWADTRPDKSVLTAPIRSGIDTLRNKLNGKTEYTQAYQDALPAYQQMAAAATPATQPAAEPSVSAVPSAPAQIPQANDTLLAPTYVPGSLGIPYTPVYPDYSSYYGSSYYPSYYDNTPYWYPGPWFGTSWWWPTFGSTIIVNGESRHEFDHDHHGHGHDADDFASRGQFNDVRGLDRNGIYWDRRFYGADRWQGDRHLGRSPWLMQPFGQDRNRSTFSGNRSTFPGGSGPNPQWNRTGTRSGEIRIVPHTPQQPNMLTQTPPWRATTPRIGAPDRGRREDLLNARPAGGMFRVQPPQRVTTLTRPGDLEFRSGASMEPRSQRLQPAPSPRIIMPQRMQPMSSPRMVSPPRSNAGMAPWRANAVQSNIHSPAAFQAGERMMAAPARPSGGAMHAAPSGGGRSHR